MTQQEVKSETLLSYPYKRKRLIYQRIKNEIKQGNKVAKLKSEVWDNLRKNCSIVSFAAQYNSQITAKQCKNLPFESNLSNKGIIEYEFDSRILRELIEKEDFNKEEITNLFKIADLGISDFEVVKRYKYKSTIELFKKWITTNNLNVEDIISSSNNTKFNELRNSIFHNRNQKNKTEDGDVLLLKHKIDDRTLNLDYSLESSGTLQFFALLREVMLVLKQGSIFIFDEIEIKLHQNLVAYIIGLFQNKYENPHGAQLIFSFHNTYFMEILKPSQLWFTQKNDRGYTEIYSAADFKDIKKLQQRSLEELYRLGRFGAKPRGI